MKSKLLIAAWLLTTTHLYAQSLERWVFSGGGGEFGVGLFVFAYTYGEPLSGTLQSTLPYQTTGFHQPLINPLLAIAAPQLEARWENGVAHLAWTADAQGVAACEIGRLHDGSFRHLHTLAAGMRYDYPDSTSTQTPGETLYYQVVAVDVWGGRHRSNIVALHPVAAQAFRCALFPNPASEYLHIALTPHPSQPVAWCLYDMQGRQLGEGIWMPADDRRLSLGSLATGSYWLECRVGAQVLRGIFYRI